MSRRSEISQISDRTCEKSEAVSLRSAVENASDAKVNLGSGSKVTMPAVTEVSQLLQLIRSKDHRSRARKKKSSFVQNGESHQMTTNSATENGDTLTTQANEHSFYFCVKIV